MKKVMFLTLVAFAVGLFAQTAQAIPPFARKYGTSCSTCHYAYPKLNGFGEAFKNNGYRYPGGDEDVVKDAPLSLGAESYKKVFPKALWPADISGMPPIGLHIVARIKYFPDAKNEGGAVTPGGHGHEEEAESGGMEMQSLSAGHDDEDADADASGALSGTEKDGISEWGFEIPHEVELLYGGTIGDTFSYFGHIEFVLEDGEPGFHFPFKVAYNPMQYINLSMGNVGPDFTRNHNRLTIVGQNVAGLTTQSGFSIGAHNAGLELWGAVDGFGGQGGFKYTLGLVNGAGFVDDNNEKDFYGAFEWKLFGHPLVGGEGGGSADFWRDDHLAIGGLAYMGTGNLDVLDSTGATTGEIVQDEYRILGGTMSAWLHMVQLNAAVLNMTTDETEHDLSDHSDPDAINKMAYFAELDLAVLPWLIPVVRYEKTDMDLDESYDEDTNPDEETNLIVGLTIMPRANIKIVGEYYKPLDSHREDYDMAVLQLNTAF